MLTLEAKFLFTTCGSMSVPARNVSQWQADRVASESTDDDLEQRR
jgi:hypothetical protein